MRGRQAAQTSNESEFHWLRDFKAKAECDAKKSQGAVRAGP